MRWAVPKCSAQTRSTGLVAVLAIRGNQLNALEQRIYKAPSNATATVFHYDQVSERVSLTGPMAPPVIGLMAPGGRGERGRQQQARLDYYLTDSA